MSVIEKRWETHIPGSFFWLSSIYILNWEAQDSKFKYETWKLHFPVCHNMIINITAATGHWSDTRLPPTKSLCKHIKEVITVDCVY